MKKIVSLMLVLVTMLTFSLSAMAANVEFVPSITNKGAPELVIIEIDEYGNKVVGYIRDAEGDIISTEHTDCLVITSVSDAKSSTLIPEDAKNTLLGVYDELSQDGTKLSELCPDLNDIVKKALGDDKNADDLVVRDVFDITALCDELKIELPKDGTTLDLTFDLSVAGNEFVTAMVYVDGAWKPVAKTVNNGDGTVTCTFDEICPVAFMVPGGESDNSGAQGSQDTDDNKGSSNVVTGDANRNSVILWGTVMVTSLAVMFVLVYRRKKNADN